MSISVSRVIENGVEKMDVGKVQHTWGLAAESFQREEVSHPVLVQNEKMWEREEYINVVIYGDYGTTKKEYLYHTFFEVQVGDLVVVETQCGYVVGQVISLLNQLPKGVHFEIKEVVQRIDLHQVEARKKQEELRGKMRAVLETMDEMELFTILAAQREDMYELWNQYQALSR